MSRSNRQQPRKLSLQPLVLALATTLTTLSLPGLARETQARGSAAILMEEVVVTARKREEGMQEAPLSVTALGSDQIEALKVRDLTSLAVGMPNVALDDIGTYHGTANFSIRGLGVNSSIPSIDPTVGVFVDGVYLGVNGGVIVDTFDLQSIEVLRGPQGVLFGRNVTGGAILMNTRKPGPEFEGSVRGAVDGGDQGGLNKYLMGTVSGPVTDTLALRLTAYWNDDEGWFEDSLSGDEVGAIEQKMIRPVILWTPTDDLEIVVRYQYMEQDGDGPAGQSHTNGSGVPGTPFNAKRDSFDFANDEKGYLDNDADFLIAQLDWAVGENGTVTNIFGWRDFKTGAVSDIDAQPLSIFHGVISFNAEQVSNELRYHGLIAERFNLTTGIYYFKNELDYAEGRRLLGELTPDDSFFQTQDGGGVYVAETAAAFATLDYDATDSLTLTGGLRYTSEDKDAKIASLILNINEPCDVIAGTCEYDFVDDESWSNWSPKLGFTYQLFDAARVYGHWTRGFRSGGYNLRNASQDLVNQGPGPFDEEQVDNFEIGFKTEWGRGRLNGALFYNEIEDMQRELNLPDPTAGVVQVIKNTADAEIFGLELDGTFSLTDSTILLASLGWIDPKYTEVKYDLNGDGVVDGADKDLDLPRAAEWTWSLTLTQDVTLGDWGYMTGRFSYAYRDESAYSDNNLGYILEQKIVDAGLDFYSNNGTWVFSLYGKNLLDEVKHGGDTQLPDKLGGFYPVGGTFAPLAKGRHYGVEVTYSF